MQRLLILIVFLKKIDLININAKINKKKKGLAYVSLSCMRIIKNCC